VIDAYFLHDVMTLTKTVGYNTLVHGKSDDRSGS
jgi:hypothetical protein